MTYVNLKKTQLSTVQNQTEKAKNKGKKRKKKERKVRGESCKTKIESTETHLNQIQRPVSVSPWRRETENRVVVTERDREWESAKPSFEQDPRRHARPRRDPLVAAATCCRCSIYLASPASSLHSSQIFTLIFSFKTLWSENQRNFACALWTYGVSCLCFYWWVMN